MTDDELTQSIIQKYGAVFWREFYDTYEDFQNQYMNASSELYISHDWNEFGVRILEIGDNNMWCELVVVRQLKVS